MSKESIQSRGVKVALLEDACEAENTAKLQRAQRLEGLSVREGHALSSTEESVLRMRHGLSVKSEALLATNNVNDLTFMKLRELELRAFDLSGRLDELSD